MHTLFLNFSLRIQRILVPFHPSDTQRIFLQSIDIKDPDWSDQTLEINT